MSPALFQSYESAKQPRQKEPTQNTETPGSQYLGTPTQNRIGETAIGFKDAGPTPAHAASGAQGRGATETHVLSRGQSFRRTQIFQQKICVARGSRN